MYIYFTDCIDDISVAIYACSGIADHILSISQLSCLIFDIFINNLSVLLLSMQA